MPKILDLVGEKYGDLVVREFAGKSEAKERLWLCECACGNTVTVTTRYLRSWGKTHCGCKNTRKTVLTNRKTDDLTGKKFGDLTVKEHAGRDKRKNRLWLCKCTCGNTVIVTTGRLTSGGKTNCGCKNKLPGRQNLINQKFGDLTVKEIIETSKWGDKLLLCECTCGNTIKVMSSSLRSGEKTHCGCKNQILEDQKEKKETTKKEMALKVITTTYDETKVAEYQHFKVCGDNFGTPYRELDILDKKMKILQLTKEKLLKATRHSTLDLFLAFLTTWV